MSKVHIFFSKNLGENTNDFLKIILKSLYPNDYIQIGTNLFGKKYLCRPHQDIQISITHNEQFIAVALSDTKIGIDIESLNVTISKNDLRSILTGKNEFVLNNTSVDKLVYLWIGMEAFLKCIGFGFLLGTNFFYFELNLSSVFLNERNEKYCLSYHKILKNNCIALCSKKLIDDVEITFLGPMSIK